MKKLLLLSLLFSACFALANNETEKKRVELTQRQKKLCNFFTTVKLGFTSTGEGS